jgi:hypothetical protein
MGMQGSDELVPFRTAEGAREKGRKLFSPKTRKIVARRKRRQQDMLVFLLYLVY